MDGVDGCASPEQNICATPCIESPDPNRRAIDRAKWCSIAGADPGGFSIPDRNALGTTYLDAEFRGSDIGTAIAFGIGNHQPRHCFSQRRAQRKSILRSSGVQPDLPLAVLNAHNIRLTVVLEIPKPEIGGWFTEILSIDKQANAAIENPPALSVGVKHIATPITHKIPDSKLAQCRIAFVEFLPRRGFGPGNEPVPSMLGEDVCTSVSAGISETQVRDLVC